MNSTTVLQYILYSIEITACITGFFHWKKLQNSFWKWFPVYLAFIVLGEQAGNYLNHTEKYQLKAKLITYVIIPMEFLFFYWVYFKSAATRKIRGVVVFCALIYLAGFIIDRLYFRNKEYYFMSFSYSVGNLSLLICIVAFFIHFTKSDRIIYFRSSLLFWVSLGLLIFYLGTLPYFGLLLFLYDEYPSVYYAYTNLMFICNSCMYLLFIIGFICAKRS